jgi:hypothetical protein
LILLGCLVMLNTSTVVDTARDAYWAWQIADGRQFPLEGPFVGSAFHGGPVWFYVLALPLVIAPGWLALNLWVGLLTGLKYVLAYACGTRLAGRNFGLLWACLLALPDWTSINYLIFSHTNLVQTLWLLCIYSLLRWREGSNRWFLMLCLALGLGIHAHPTVYAAGLLALPFVLKSLWRRQLGWGWLAAGALAAAIPLAPYLVSQQLNQWPDLDTGAGYFQSQPLWMNLLGSFDVMRGALLDGPVVALRHVLGLDGAGFYAAAAVIVAISGGGVLLSFISMIRNDPHRVGLSLLAATLISIAAVAVIRDVTPFYQTFVIYPPFYALVAWGWSRGLVGDSWPPRVLAPVSLAALTCFYLATLQTGREGRLQIPPTSLMNVQAHRTAEFADTVYYPGWGRHALGAFICGAGRPLTLHGFASLILEQSYALEARMLCDSDAVYLGGQGEGRHYLGVSHADARELGIRSTQSLGSMDVFDVTQVLAPAKRVDVPPGDVYPPRPYVQNEAGETTLEFVASGAEILAITNLYHFWMPHRFSVSLNGQPAEPLNTGAVNAYFACPGCNPDELHRWSVTIEAPQPELVEVVTFTPHQRTP